MVALSHARPHRRRRRRPGPRSPPVAASGSFRATRSSRAPGAGQAIAFHLIPFYNLYWHFFQPLRLCDRLDLQAKLRGLPSVAPRGLVLACSIMTIIPLANYVALLIMWPIAAGMTQSAINKLAAMPPSTFDATPPPALPPGYPPQAGYPQQRY